MKKTISIILIVVALAGMITAIAAGTQEDPLITQEYAENTYRNIFVEFINEKVASDHLNRVRVDALTENTGFEFNPKITKKALTYRDEVTLLPGSSFTLSSGSASVMFSSGSVINVSTGSITNSGTQLTVNQRYFCAEDTKAIVLSTGSSTGFIDGYYKIDSNPITGFVERLYREVLGRQSDENGLKGWVDAITSGKISGADAAREFVFCAEVTSKNHSNEKFVEILYKTMLGRTPEPAGKAGWVGALNSGWSRQRVFEEFVVSAEFAQICSDYGLTPTLDSKIPAGIRVFVTRLYIECLGRQPDLQGRDSWMRAIHNGSWSGSQMAHAFVFCDELNRKNLSNADFVDVLYRTMLGRIAEPEGKASWTNALNSGWSRQRVFESFVNSEEYAEICRTLGVRK